ncbi:ankyrin repeat protein [Lentzea atacamensis]|uniref:Ankyrin repeat protein n=2 Tax=Lentzea atacamensis TaxID=531938 RepID=A0ABX9E1W2_9PSEU|nr:ankyrin repeat protein [Lentzea atacamensis]
MESEGWRGFPSTGWQSVDAVRRRLDAGADPNTGPFWMTPLRSAVEFGTAEVVAEVAARVDDVDQLDDGRSALWQAVYEGKADIARALLAAGADPSRPMMSGWSPARLSLVTGNVIPSGEVLTDEEERAVRECGRLTLALKGFRHYDGYSIACVAGIDAEEATRRLNATVVPTAEVPPEVPAGDWWPAPFGEDTERALSVTDVPGGCVLVQPWYFNAQTPVVMKLLSAGTVAYGMYANPKSGNQGNIHRDGQTVGRDLHPGGGPGERDSTFEVLLAHLYAHKAVAYCCAYVGLRPKNDKAFTDPDRWLLLPDIDFWRS